MKKQVIPIEAIQQKIYYIRGEKVMFDRDLAVLYGVTTGNLNKAVKRNKSRFPADFMFQLNRREADIFLRFQSGNLNDDNLRFQNGTSRFSRSQSVTLEKNLIFQNGISSWGGTRKLPYVFTEQGVAMLSSVLNSKWAIQVNIQIMRTFTKLRKLLATHKELKEKIERIERKYDKQFRVVFEVIKMLIKEDEKPKKRIGFQE